MPVHAEVSRQYRNTMHVTCAVLASAYEARERSRQTVASSRQLRDRLQNARAVRRAEAAERDSPPQTTA